MIYKSGDVEFGKIPTRQEITVLDADDSENLKIGFVVRERIGAGVFNPRGLYTHNIYDWGFYY